MTNGFLHPTPAKCYNPDPAYVLHSYILFILLLIIIIQQVYSGYEMLDGQQRAKI